jgi:hypothetical protein
MTETFATATTKVQFYTLQIIELEQLLENEKKQLIQKQNATNLLKRKLNIFTKTSDKQIFQSTMDTIERYKQNISKQESDIISKKKLLVTWKQKAAGLKGNDYQPIHQQDSLDKLQIQHATANIHTHTHRKHSPVTRQNTQIGLHIERKKITHSRNYSNIF